MSRFEEAQAVVAPVYDIADLLADPHLAHHDAITALPDPELGTVRMPNVPFRLAWRWPVRYRPAALGRDRRGRRARVRRGLLPAAG